MEEAAEFLGYPWFVTGEVVHGDKRGRELGFPTANLVLDASCGLRHGIYAVRAGIGGRRYDGVASFGRRPMFDIWRGAARSLSVRFLRRLYGQRIDVAFIAWLREEAAFASVDALVAQMHEDARRAREALMRAGDAFPPI